MKVIIFSDIHIHDYKQHSQNKDRLGVCLSALRNICAIAHINGSNILFSGDLFDTHKALLTSVINRTIATFTEIFTDYPDMQFFAITGNHDQSTKNLLEAPAISALEHLQTVFPANFILIDNTVRHLGDGIILAGIPYYEFKEHFNQRLKDISDEVAAMSIALNEKGLAPKPYLLIHQTAKGSNPMIPYDTDPTDPLYDLYEHTYCGHIHLREELTSGFTNIGSPIHRDLADAGTKKGVYIRNLAKPEKGHKFIYLYGFPEILIKKDTDVVTEEDSQDNYIVIENTQELIHTGEANVEEFNTSLANDELLTNYWKEVDGKNDLLLQTGLKLIK